MISKIASSTYYYLDGTFINRGDIYCKHFGYISIVIVNPNQQYVTQHERGSKQHLMVEIV